MPNTESFLERMETPVLFVMYKKVLLHNCRKVPAAPLAQHQCSAFCLWLAQGILEMFQASLLFSIRRLETQSPISSSSNLLKFNLQ